MPKNEDVQRQLNDLFRRIKALEDAARTMAEFVDKELGYEVTPESWGPGDAVTMPQPRHEAFTTFSFVKKEQKDA